jgi:hypothetical protein
VRILKAANMAPARAAAYLGGATLLVAWLASAAGVSRTRPDARPAAPPGDVVRLDAVATDVQSQAVRLRARLASAPALASPRRNPFSFAAPAAIRVRHAAPAPALAPVAAQPFPDLVLELAGIAEQKVDDAGVKRTAMVIGPGDQLFMVTQGQELAGRYRVSAVGADAVELEDLSTGATRRLALR